MSITTLEEEFYRSGARLIGPLRRLELVFVRGSDRAILYVYDDCGSGQVAGSIDELREIARTRYPDAELHEMPLDGLFEVVSASAVVGVCRDCGCTDNDCRSCIERTGAPCSWANEEHSLCTACARSRTSLRSGSTGEVAGSNPAARSYDRIKATV